MSIIEQVFSGTIFMAGALFLFYIIHIFFKSIEISFRDEEARYTKKTY